MNLEDSEDSRLSISQLNLRDTLRYSNDNIMKKRRPEAFIDLSYLQLKDEARSNNRISQITSLNLASPFATLAKDPSREKENKEGKGESCFLGAISQARGTHTNGIPTKKKKKI